MQKLAKIVQFIGIVVTGIGLIYGIGQNDMRMEFIFMGAGIVIFFLGFIMERR